MNVQEVLQQLQTLDMQNPGAWPRWVRATAVTLTIIILVGAGTYFLVQPVYDQWRTEQGQEQGLRKTFEDKQKKVAALDAFRAQLADMEKLFGSLLKQLPSRAEIANLLNDVSQTRVAASLEEELFRPRGEIPKDFYAIVPNEIVVVGDYHEMGSFVGAIAALPRIVTIENVKIQSAGRKGDPSRLRMSAVAQTYRYLDDSEIEAAKPKKKGGKKR